MDKLNLRMLDVTVDKTALCKYLNPEQLRKYIEGKGWKKRIEHSEVFALTGYDVYEYHTNGLFTVMIATPSNWMLQEEYLKAHDLRQNFVSLVATHYISELDILSNIFELCCEEEVVSV